MQSNRIELSDDPEFKAVLQAVHQVYADTHVDHPKKANQHDDRDNEREGEGYEIPEGVEEVGTGKRGKFLFHNQRAILTYKGHADKKQYEAWFRKVFRAFPIEQLIIAHEVGLGDPHCPYPHTHVYVDFGKLCKRENARCFDCHEVSGIENPHPHIKKIVVGRWRPLEPAILYVCKEDPSLAALKEHYMKKKKGGSVAEVVWAAKDRNEAAKLAKTPSEVTGILKLYDMKGDNRSDSFRERLQEQENGILELELFPWQKDLLEHLEKKPSWQSRKILWYYDHIGNTGKSTFIDYLRAKDGRDGTRKYLAFTHFGGVGNAADCIRRELDSGWDSWAVLIDLPRSCEDWDIYGALENIKNGKITCTKYEGRFLEFPRPHVVVFANFPPNRGKMSADRWAIRDITPGVTHTDPHPYREVSSSPPVPQILIEERTTRVETFATRRDV